MWRTWHEAFTDMIDENDQIDVRDNETKPHILLRSGWRDPTLRI